MGCEFQPVNKITLETPDAISKFFGSSTDESKLNPPVELETIVCAKCGKTETKLLLSSYRGVE